MRIFLFGIYLYILKSHSEFSSLQQIPSQFAVEFGFVFPLSVWILKLTSFWF